MGNNLLLLLQNPYCVFYTPLSKDKPILAMHLLVDVDAEVVNSEIWQSCFPSKCRKCSSFISRKLN